jgi:hypothetical protein
MSADELLPGATNPRETGHLGASPITSAANRNSMTTTITYADGGEVFPYPVQALESLVSPLAQWRVTLKIDIDPGR